MMRGMMVPAALVAALFVLYGCLNTQGGHAANDTVAVEEVHSGAVCNDRSPSPQVAWIGSHQQLEARWQLMHSHLLGGSPPSAPQVDWKAHGLLFISMGQKNSGGYAIKLSRSHARLQGGAAFVDIDWIEPPKGAVVSMALTSPCLLVKIQKGTYRSVVIMDPSGHQRAMVNIPQ